jgi:hypothetical protein
MYGRYKDNFKLELIYNNPDFGTGRNMSVKFDDTFFGAETMQRFRDNIKQLTWKKLIINAEFVTFDEFEFISGISLTRGRYNQLKQTFLKLVKKFPENDPDPISIEIFFGRIKKGSRRFRNVMSYAFRGGDFYGRNTQIKSFAKCTETRIPDSVRCSQNLSCWNTYSFPNRFKIFLFKYYHNILGTGNRVLHFNPGADVSCVFCGKSRLLPSPLETFAHVFYFCPSVENIINQFCDKYCTRRVSKQEYFTGTVSLSEKENKTVSLVFDILRYCIWQCKLAKKIMSFTTIELETKE